MDEALKARLIGAAVLVALAVLLIPELLSGRKAAEPVAAQPGSDRSTRTFSIELGGGSSGTTVVPPAGEAAAPSHEPSERAVVAAATQGGGEKAVAPPKVVEPEAAVELPKPEPRTQAAESKAAAPSARPVGSGTGSTPAAAKPDTPDSEPPPPQDTNSPAARGGWAVQVGAFGSLKAANTLVSQLQGAGYGAYVSPVTRNGRTLHRVRVGPEADRAAAEKLVAGLKARGLPTTVVAND